jgi:type VI protein secretion system component VasF
VQLGELLDQFDATVLLGNNGRTAHKSATQQLEELAAELAAVVRTMDARNRQRFQGNAQLLPRQRLSRVSESPSLRLPSTSETHAPPRLW